MGMSKDEIQKMFERVDIMDRWAAALNEVDALAKREHEWRMHIPARDTDSDVVITSALQDIRPLVVKVKKLEDEIEALRAALAFYADVKCYEHPEDGYFTFRSAVDVDEGERARMALEPATAPADGE